MKQIILQKHGLFLSPEAKSATCVRFNELKLFVCVFKAGATLKTN